MSSRNYLSIIKPLAAVYFLCSISSCIHRDLPSVETQTRVSHKKWENPIRALVGPMMSAIGLAVTVPASLTGCSATVSNHPRIGIVLRGMATYYSDRLAGNTTANGEIYRPRLMTAAHRTLPFGSRVRVTNLQNQRTVEVRINDRGPFGNRERIIDVSRGAAEELAMIRAGVVPVTVEILQVPGD